MKIAIDIRAATGNRTGKGQYVFNLLRAILKQDTKNDYLLYTKDKIAGFESFKNAKFVAIRGKSLSWHFKVLKDLSNRNVDIFWAPSSYILPALLPSRIKSVITVHDLVAFLFPDSHNKKATVIEKIFLKRACKKATKILAVSKNTKKDLLEHFELDSEKIEVIYCAASENFKPLKSEELKDFAKKTNLPKKFFLAVGTLEPRKNYPALLHAFYEFSKIYPDYHLVVVGGEGWQFQEVYDLVDYYNLRKKVHFLGYLSGKSLNGLYNLATALVFPSFYEGFGIPPLEAMRCGCPVIASKIASIPEVLADSALYVNPEKHKSIVNALDNLAKRSDLQKNLSLSGLKQAKNFSWEKSGKEFVRLFDQT